MAAKRVSKAEQYQLITECRQSGLSDKQWCIENGIKPGTFYNWVKRLRQADYVIPKSEATDKPKPYRQDVVRVDVIPDFTAGPQGMNEAHVCEHIQIADSKNAAPIEICMGNMVVRIRNTADPALVGSLIGLLGGAR